MPSPTRPSNTPVRGRAKRKILFKRESHSSIGQPVRVKRLRATFFKNPYESDKVGPVGTTREDNKHTSLDSFFDAITKQFRYYSNYNPDKIHKEKVLYEAIYNLFDDLCNNRYVAETEALPFLRQLVTALNQQNTNLIFQEIDDIKDFVQTKIVPKQFMKV